MSISYKYSRIAGLIGWMFIMASISFQAWCADPAVNPDSMNETSSQTVTPMLRSPGHFTWGVDISSGVDLTENDMTMFSLGAGFGYRGGWLQFAGVGASIISMMNNSSRCYPVYAVVRTSFSSRPQLCFMELRGGVSFNSILESKSQSGAYVSAGCGITLARSRSFSSYIMVRGVVMPVKGVFEDEAMNFRYTLGFACIGLGIAF